MTTLELYREGLQMVSDLVAGLPDPLLMQVCPQCPDWTIRDVVAHLVDVAEKNVRGGVEVRRRASHTAIVDPDMSRSSHAASVRDENIQRAVNAYKDLPFREVLRIWRDVVDEAQPKQLVIPVADLAVHLGDIEEALGGTASRQSAVHGAALELYGSLVSQRLTARNLDQIQIRGSEPDVSAASPDAPHQVSGTTYDLLRNVTGRRSRREGDEMLRWGTTPLQVRSEFPVYGWLATDSAAL